MFQAIKRYFQSCEWKGHKFKSWNPKLEEWCDGDHDAYGNHDVIYEDWCYHCPEKCLGCGVMKHEA